MSDDFYPFVDSGDPAPDNEHLNPTGKSQVKKAVENSAEGSGEQAAEQVRYATRIAVYDDMLSTPRVIVVDAKDVRTYLEEVTNTVYRCMKEQGGHISLMVIREIVENFIHAHFVEPIISVLDGGDTIRFADQGPGIEDKERAFEFGVTSADREQKRYIRGTGAGFPMVQQYLENAGGAVSIEDNMGQGTVVTVTVDAKRVVEVERAGSRGAAVRGAAPKRAVTRETAAGSAEATEAAGQLLPQQPVAMQAAAAPEGSPQQQIAAQQWGYPQQMQQAQQGYPRAYPAGQAPAYPQQMPGYGYPAPGYPPQPAYMAGYPQQNGYQQGYGQAAGYPPQQGMWPGYPYPPQQPMAGAEAAGGAAGMPAGGQASASTGPMVSERGKMAMAFLAEHGSCGPTDLAAAFGSSNATWSRELEALSSQGLAVKQGQKRVLTDMGRLWLDTQASTR